MNNSNMAQSNELAKSAKQLPPSTQFAIVNVLPNICNGAFWGFTTVNEVNSYAADLKVDSNIKLRRVGTDVIVEVDPNYIIKVLTTLGSGVATQKDINMMTDYSAKAIVDFEKFLKTKSKKAFSGYVGVYCINDTPSITYKGTVYPAFRLPLVKLLELCSKFNYAVKVRDQWVSPKHAMDAGQALFDSLIISPTKTGAFIEIRSLS